MLGGSAEQIVRFRTVVDLNVRAALRDEQDERFLWLMLIEAASWRAGARRIDVDEAAGEPGWARYVAGWGRRGDTGIIAERGGSRVGAAWWRFFDETDHGYGFVERGIPELSIGVIEQLRGRGIDSVLLSGLIERAREQELPAISLSVEVDNPAIRLYERVGFTRVIRVGNAWTMRLDTTAG